MVNITKIKELAEQRGVKLSFICSQIGVDRSYFHAVERRNGDIPVERLIKIANILQTTVEYLVDETDDSSKAETQFHLLSDRHIFLRQTVLEKVLRYSDHPDGEEKLQKLLDYIEFLEFCDNKKK